MSDQRFDRNIRFFGEEGQKRISVCKVVIAGIGGLGGHVGQQLALLGVRQLSLIEPEELAETDRNRHVCAWAEDPVPGSRKVDICERLVHLIDPTIAVNKVPHTLVSEDAFSAVKQADYVFGCLDTEGARLVLTELCSAYERPYIDLATDIIPGERVQYGGRVCYANGKGCLVCLSELDQSEAGEDLSGPLSDALRRDLYGIKQDELGGAGPSVVSINGVVASLAVTEFAVTVSGIRNPKKILYYYAEKGIVRERAAEPYPDCYYCRGIRGHGESADVERYIRDGVGDYLT